MTSGISSAQAQSRILCWRRKKFNHMPIGVAKKNLRCAVGARFPEREISADFFQVTFPWVEIVHSQSEVVIFMAREERRAQVGYEMQFLIRAKPEPSSRKTEGRTRHRLKSQNIPIKLTALFHIGHVEGHVFSICSSLLSLLSPSSSCLSSLPSSSPFFSQASSGGEIHADFQRDCGS